MANVDGDVQKRITLTANEETVVEFSNLFHDISIKASSGTVYFKFNGTILSTSDTSANYLVSGESYDIHKGADISTLHLYSDSAASVQWDIP